MRTPLTLALSVILTIYLSARPRRSKPQVGEQEERRDLEDASDSSSDLEDLPQVRSSFWLSSPSAQH